MLLLILGVIIIYNKKVDVKKYNIDNKTEEIKAYVDENFDDIANMFEDVYKRIS